MKSVMRLIEAVGRRDRPATIAERLKDAPVERLEVEIARMLREHSFTTVRAAFTELLEWAPVEDFPRLREIFRKRFAN